MGVGGGGGGQEGEPGVIGGGGEGERVPAKLPAPPWRPLWLLLLPSPELLCLPPEILRPSPEILRPSPELLRLPPEILHLLSASALRPLSSVKLLRHTKGVGVSGQICVVNNFEQSYQQQQQQLKPTHQEQQYSVHR